MYHTIDKGENILLFLNTLLIFLNLLICELKVKMNFKTNCLDVYNDNT